MTPQIDLGSNQFIVLLIFYTKHFNLLVLIDFTVSFVKTNNEAEGQRVQSPGQDTEDPLWEDNLARVHREDPRPTTICAASRCVVTPIEKEECQPHGKVA